MATERLQKILARAGVASRRAAEQMIKAGYVRVNGRIVAELGTKADIVRDKVEVHGRRVVAEQPVYFMLHKPREVITTLADPEKRESVADLMKPVAERIFPIGRLDYHTSGALLLTNDGEMTQALLHPRKHVPKTYIAKLKGPLSLANLQALREGVVLDDGQRTRKADLFVLNEERGNTWLQITITEGMNRQIHRMGDAIGHRVMRLSRVSFAGISVEGLRPGQSRPLGATEIAKLKRDYLNPSKREKAQQAEGEFGEAPARREAPARDERAVAPRRPSRTFPERGRAAVTTTPDRELVGARVPPTQGRPPPPPAAPRRAEATRSGAALAVTAVARERQEPGGRFRNAKGRPPPTALPRRAEATRRGPASAAPPAREEHGRRFRNAKARPPVRATTAATAAAQPQTDGKRAWNKHARPPVRGATTATAAQQTEADGRRTWNTKARPPQRRGVAPEAPKEREASRGRLRPTKGKGRPPPTVDAVTEPTWQGKRPQPARGRKASRETS